jgi:hypothetical protein
MLWVTTRHVHLDRVATPWLILRFVDPDAQFSFVPWFGDFQGPAGAIPLSLPGAELAAHDHEATCFERVLRKYAITDPAVLQIGKAVAAGIAYLVRGVCPAPDDRIGQIGVGLLAISDGMMMTHETDQEILDANMPVYDALHARFKTEIKMRADGLTAPAHTPYGPGARNEFLRALVQEPW